MIFDTFMFRDELDALEMRLEELADTVDRHVLVESRTTHRGVPKPLWYQRSQERFAQWADKIVHVVVDLPYDPNPWVREHRQRHAAWPSVDIMAEDGDVVLICDVDEIPSKEALKWSGPGAVSVYMRTCIFAVDWEIVSPIPPASVMATAGHIRSKVAENMGLGDIRDQRSSYPMIGGGGWHISWLGGPEKQMEKLDTATCHTEMADTPEAELIRNGLRYAKGLDGGGHKVAPVDVDESWPRYIYERRCPSSWFRPRDEGEES